MREALLPRLRQPSPEHPVLLAAGAHDALSAKLATKPELLAAGYNSNAAKLPGYLKRGRDNWKGLIPRETQMYLQIYSALERAVPMTPRTR